VFRFSRRYVLVAVAVFVGLLLAVVVVLATGWLRREHFHTGRSAAVEPWAASFVSPSTGYVLGTVACHFESFNPGFGCRLVVVVTRDAGKSWSRLHVPSVPLVDNPYDGGVTGITFANLRDGWLWGSQVWSTQDGGLHWRRAHIAGQVTGLLVSGRRAYVSSQLPIDGPTLLRSSIGGAAWRPVGTPHNDSLVQEAQSDGSPLLVPVSNGVIAGFDDVYARRGVTAYARVELWRTGAATRWEKLADVCTTNTTRGVAAGSPDNLTTGPGGTTGTTGSVAAGSQGVDSLSAGPRGDLLAVCSSGSGKAPSLELSTDGGRHFRRVPTSSRLDADSWSEVFSAGRPGTALATFPASWLQIFHIRHAARIHSLMFRTANGGRTWTTRSYTDDGSGWGPLQFISPNVGWVIRGAPGAPVDQLLRTTNDGAAFHAVPLPAVSFRGPREPVTRPLTNAFEPWSTSFVSTSRGFVLGTRRCSWSLGSADGACRATLLATSDAGAKWQTLPVPRVSLAEVNETPATVTSVTFADRDDGWLAGASLWATHDGGQHWTRIAIPGPPESALLSDVVASGGWAYVALSTINRVTLLRTPVGADDWQAVPGNLPHGKYGADVEALTAVGGNVWLGLGVTGSPEYQLWEARPGSALIYRGNPCAKAGPQHIGINSMTATSPNDLVISCGPGKLDTSTDGGAHLTPVPAPKGGDYLAPMASPPGRPDTIVMTWPSNYGGVAPPSNRPSWIDQSANDGRTWTRVYYHDGLAGWGDPQFVSPEDGWIIHGYPGTTDQLMRTTNAGATFTAIRF
jgi:photosystem II stability/assembly factor-like uncharacterized protein